MEREDELNGEIRHLARERRARTEAEHVAPEDLAAYQDGTLPLERAEAVEEHLAWCPACSRVLLAFEDLKGAIVSSPPRREERRPRWLLRVAAILCIAAGLAAPWLLRRPGDDARPPATAVAQAGVPYLDLDLQERRAPSDPIPRLPVSGGGRFFVLVVWLSPDYKGPLQALVLDTHGQVAWRSEPFRPTDPDHFALVLSRDVLQDRRYTVKIEEVRKDGRRILGERDIEIVSAP
jgi:hypothetical protein